MPTLKLTIEYDGARFVGWQVQPNGPSVQQALVDAIEKLCGERLRVTGAGRTDAGVHARGQVVSISPVKELPLKAWTAGLNALLPETVACVSAETAPEGFDARRWARGKRYVYTLKLSPVRSPLWSARAWELRRQVDVAAMQQALGHFIGTHDFSSLRAADCPAKTTVRTMSRLSIDADARADGVWHVSVEATAFLKHMVRNLVGTLVDVGIGKRTPESMAALLAARDRTLAGPTAPPHALVFDEVFYLPGNADPYANPGALDEDDADA
ncbi:MAG: tRNA pseudouridine(38-40) synthase TruA [Deltaproteobacteria bacterium]|nr:tRNA pseudouridine(38-40) synthase TruA [Deltaproteobacteria bacterium]